MSSVAIQPREDEDRFAHDAVFYAGMDDFVAQAVPFITEGVDAGEPILVVVSVEKIARLRAALNGRSDRVRFADMADVGQNPARIIPAWRAFVSEQHPAGPSGGSGNRSGRLGAGTSSTNASVTRRC